MAESGLHSDIAREMVFNTFQIFMNHETNTTCGSIFDLPLPVLLD